MLKGYASFLLGGGGGCLVAAVIIKIITGSYHWSYAVHFIVIGSVAYPIAYLVAARNERRRKKAVNQN